MRGEVDYVGRPGSRAPWSPVRIGACLQAEDVSPGAGDRHIGHGCESLLSQRIPARSGVGFAGARGWGRSL